MLFVKEIVVDILLHIVFARVNVKEHLSNFGYINSGGNDITDLSEAFTNSQEFFTSAPREQKKYPRMLLKFDKT